jgi:hypothetical protein
MLFIELHRTVLGAALAAFCAAAGRASGASAPTNSFPAAFDRRQAAPFLSLARLRGYGVSCVARGETRQQVDPVLRGRKGVARKA